MDEQKAHAAAVAQGYADAQVGAGVWKRTGRAAPPASGLKGAALEAWVDAMAERYPGRVS